MNDCKISELSTICVEACFAKKSCKVAQASQPSLDFTGLTRFVQNGSRFLRAEHWQLHSRCARVPSTPRTQYGAHFEKQRIRL